MHPQPSLSKKPARLRRPLASFFTHTLPIDPRSIGPEAFQVVDFPQLGREDVHDHIAKILHDPLALVGALDALPPGAGCLELLVDFLGDRHHLAAAGAGGEHEEIKNRRDLRQIQNQRVLALKAIRNPGTSASLQQTFPNRLRPVFACGYEFGRGRVVGFLALLQLFVNSDRLQMGGKTSKRQK